MCGWVGRQIASRFWEILDADNKISLAVCQIDPQSGAADLEILNKYSAV